MCKNGEFYERNGFEKIIIFLSGNVHKLLDLRISKAENVL